MNPPAFAPPPPPLCVVCDDELPALHRATCQLCGGRFHHPWLPDCAVPRCGQAASHDDTLAVIFLCRPCHASRRNRPSAPPAG